VLSALERARRDLASDGATAERVARLRELLSATAAATAPTPR
jgi:hypothetical protein